MIADVTRSIPGPWRTALYLASADPAVLARAAFITLRNAFLGFSLAVAAAAILTFISRLSPLAARYVLALNTIVQSVSVLVWAIVAIMIFGVLSPVPPVLVSAAAVFPPTLSNFLEALRAVDRRLMDLARILGAGRLDEFRHIIVPASVPYLAAATRSGLGLALRISVVAEAFGGSGGVGFMIVRSYNLMEPAGVLAWASLLVVIMVLMDGLFLTRLVGVAERWRLP